MRPVFSVRPVEVSATAPRTARVPATSVPRMTATESGAMTIAMPASGSTSTPLTAIAPIPTPITGAMTDPVRALSMVDRSTPSMCSPA